jgi:PAS domain S-box-containing protein
MNPDRPEILATQVSNSCNQFSLAAFDHLPVAVYTCDQRGYITSFNKAAVKLWGREPQTDQDQWSGAYKIYNTDGVEMSRELSPAALLFKEKTATADGTELIIERPDATKARVKVFPSLLFDTEGVPNGVINTVLEATGTRELDEKQARLAAIVDNSDDAIISKTLKGFITSWNKAAEKLFGYTEAEAIGKHITMLIPPERIAEEDYIITNIARGNRIDHFETIRVSKYGRLIPISLTVSPIKDRDGNIIGASKIARDISIQKEARDAALHYTKRLETLNAIIKATSEDLDIEKILQKVTDAATALTGAKFGIFFYSSMIREGSPLTLYTLSGVSQKTFDNLARAEGSEFFQNMFNSTTAVRVDDIAKDPDDRRRCALRDHLKISSYIAAPVIARTGEVIGGLLLAHSETGRFSAEQESLIASIASQSATGLENAKLYDEVKILNDKKDEFIGLASHELKTPLTSITGYLQILSRLKPDEKSKKFVNKTINQVKKLSGLVSDLLDISKIEAGKLELSDVPFDINSIVEEAVELIQHSQGSHEVRYTPNTLPLMVMGDSQRIEQVIINLLTNAIKYSPSASLVEVSLQHTQHEITVSVKDYGFGIEQKHLDKIFSRFYRVEGVGPTISGLGIGLYLSHEIIQRHGGKLWAESEPGKGSTFSFTLPLQ